MNNNFVPLPEIQESYMNPRTMLRRLQGLKKLRELYPDEKKFFKENPHVSGMATEDDRVILNDYSPLSEGQKKAVYDLEESRLHMKKSKNRPKFELTPEQKQYFIQQIKYSPDPQDVKETIVSRILAGDSYQPLTTPEQVKYTEDLREEMKRDREIKKLASTLNKRKS